MRSAVAPQKVRRLLLIGMMGAGKTTVGRLLADELGWAYVDSDEQVEAMTGQSVRELFERGGEQAFRPLEAHALAAALAREEPAVVSVAGGAVLEPANRSLIRRAGTVVWLRARPATLARRVLEGAEAPRSGDPAPRSGDPALRSGDPAPRPGDPAPRSDHRPLLEHDPAGTLARLDALRRPVYDALADVIVDVDELTPEAVVARVLGSIGARPAGRRRR
jgi:shikimate kinase